MKRKSLLQWSPLLIVIFGLATPYIPEYHNFPIRVNYRSIPFTFADIYFRVDNAISADNPIEIEAWVNLPSVIADQGIDHVTIIFDGSWQAPVDRANVPKTGLVRLEHHPDREKEGEDWTVYKGSTRIIYPTQGRYNVTLEVATKGRDYFVSSDETYPSIQVHGSDTTITLREGRTIRGLSYVLVGIAIMGVLAATGTEKVGTRKDKSY
ncbi:MAG: hypothetical protein V3U49_01375 [Nitrososphaerales archaeon]